MLQSYDYIVIGAGSASCTAAKADVRPALLDEPVGDAAMVYRFAGPVGTTKNRASVRAQHALVREFGTLWIGHAPMRQSIASANTNVIGDHAEHCIKEDAK